MFKPKIVITVNIHLKFYPAQIALLCLAIFIGVDSLQIFFAKRNLIYVEDQPFSLPCNIEFAEIGIKYPQLFSWNLVENDKRVTGQMLVLNNTTQARVQYKCVFTLGSLKIEKPVNITVIGECSSRFIFLSSV